jgi:Cu+-exporting ATPase
MTKFNAAPDSFIDKANAAPNPAHAPGGSSLHLPDAPRDSPASTGNLPYLRHVART